MKCHSTESSIKITILQTCVYATPSFMLGQCSGTVGFALFSCYVKASKENTKYEQYTILIHNIIIYLAMQPRPQSTDRLFNKMSS